MAGVDFVGTAMRRDAVNHAVALQGLLSVLSVLFSILDFYPCQAKAKWSLVCSIAQENAAGGAELLSSAPQRPKMQPFHPKSSHPSRRTGTRASARA